MTEKHKNCVVMVTYRIDKSLMRFIRYLHGCISGYMDFVVAFDCAKGGIEVEQYPEISFFMFNSTTIHNYFHQGNPLLANPLKALFEFSETHQYEHYLFLEYDIVLNGDFQSFIQLLNCLARMDYIHIATDMDGSPARHWPITFIRNNPYEDVRFAWSQMFYVSNKLLSRLKSFTRDNDTFYFEFLLPTVAYNEHFIVSQFENWGYRFNLSWGPSTLFEHIYLHERRPKTFYHPIKNHSIIIV